MNFDFNNAFDGKRLTSMSRARVQSNGQLKFPPEAARQLNLTLDSALLICPMGEKDLAVAVVGKDDARGFPLRKSGPYYYVPFRSLMNELGIDCAKQHVVYDIIELNERHEGKSVFKFNRRFVGASEVEAEETAEEAAAGEAAAAEEVKEAAT